MSTLHAPVPTQSEDMPERSVGRFATLAIALVFLTFLFRWRARALGAPVLDTQLGYSPERAFELLQVLDSAGKLGLYAVTQATLDLLYPLVYGLLLHQVLHRLSGSRRVALLPVAAAVADLVENATIIVLAVAYPTTLRSVAWFAAGATVAKLVLLGASLLVVAGYGVVAWRRNGRVGAWKGRDLVVATALVLAAVLLVVLRLPLVMAVLGLLVLWLQARGLFVLQYLFFLRFPLLFGMLLLFLPELAALQGVAPLVGNLFVLDGPGQMFVVGLAAGLLGVTVVSALRVVFLTAAPRCKLAIIRVDRSRQHTRAQFSWENARWAWLYFPRLDKNLPWLGALLALPFLLEVIHRSPGAGWWAALFGLLTATGTALVARLGWGRSQEMLLEEAGAVRAPMGELVRKMKNPEADMLVGFGGQGHFAVLAWVSLVFLGYVALGFLAFPAPARTVDTIPALVYVFLIVVWSMWALSVLSLILDRRRVPVVLAAVAALFVAYAVNSVDSYHEVMAREGPAPGSPTDFVTAWDSVRAVRGVPARDAMTVVTVSGGGIKASLWSARVLQALDSIVGPAFTSSVALLSTNSGGSVGTMYFTDGFTAEGPPDGEQLRRMVGVAGASSLSASAWAMAYPDLANLLTGGFSRSWSGGALRTLDRGWALDRRWERRRVLLQDSLSDFSAPPRRLSGWIEGVRAGWRPVHIFNATVVESGAPFRLATVDLGTEVRPPAPGSQPQEFYDTYPGHDIELATAARLSAAFPWITPMSRPWDALKQEQGPAYRVADGGYFDNYGVFSAIEFLTDVGPEQLVEMGIRRVLFVEIRASKEEDVERAPGGLHYELFGPVLAMNNVLFASQIANNRLALELFRRAWAVAGLDVCPVPLSLTEPGPLSWHLSREDIAAVVGAWTESEHGAKAREAARFLEGAAPCPPGGGVTIDPDVYAREELR